MRVRALVASVVGAALTMAACGSSSKSSSPSTTAAGGATTTAGGGGKCMVGVSWNNYQEERWAKFDEPAIKKAVEAGGGTYISNDAKSSAETQATQRREPDLAGRQGADHPRPGRHRHQAVRGERAVERRARSSRTTASSRTRARSTSPSTTCWSGSSRPRRSSTPCRRATTSSSRATRPTPTPTSCAPATTRSSSRPSTSGDIKIVGETYTDNWDPSKAQTETEQFLTSANNKVQAVLSENDGMAGGVVAALTAQGLAGKVPVSGQDGDQAALNRIALGTQTVDVWKDARLLGKTAGDAAIAALQEQGRQQGHRYRRRSRARVATASRRSCSRRMPITKANLNVVIDAGWTTKDERVQGREGRLGPGLLMPVTRASDA